MANPVVSSLPAYVEQNQTPLIAKLAFGLDSAKLFTVQTGCKGPTAINTLTAALRPKNRSNAGGSCGWDDSNNKVTLSQRTINAMPMTANLSICDAILVGKYAQNKVRWAAGEEVLPFEEEFCNEIIRSWGDNLDYAIVNGGMGYGIEDGQALVHQLVNDSAVIKPTLAIADGAYANIQKVYEAIPADIVFDEDTTILVDNATYREFVTALVEKNLYHWDGKLDKEGVYFPGSTVKVKPFHALLKNTYFAYNKKEMFYGTDLEGDSEKLDVWYSKDNQEFRVAIKTIAGLQYAFSDHVVYAVAA